MGFSKETNKVIGENISETLLSKLLIKKKPGIKNSGDYITLPNISEKKELNEVIEPKYNKYNEIRQRVSGRIFYSRLTNYKQVRKNIINLNLKDVF